MKKGYKQCPHCEARVKAKKYHSHIRNVHGEEDRPASLDHRKKRKDRHVGKRDRTQVKKVIFLVSVALVIGIIITASLIFLNTRDKGGVRDNDDQEGEFTQRSITTGDGWTVNGRDYYSSQYNPTIVLLHGLNTDQSVWDPIVFDLHGLGYNVITMDLRGLGSSTSVNGEERTTESPYFTGDDYLAMPGDVKVFVQRVINAHDIKNREIIVVGASIGSNIGMIYAKEDPRVSGLVLLSPVDQFATEEAKDSIPSLMTRSVLVMVGTQDSSSINTAHMLDDELDDSLLSAYSGTSHGSDILTDEPGSVAAIEDWITTKYPVS
jgi:pimeloyl-ACP methyl ester carboxylesterase